MPCTRKSIKMSTCMQQRVWTMTHSDAYKPTISLCCSAIAQIFSQHGISPFSCAYNTPTPARSKEHSKFRFKGRNCERCMFAHWRTTLSEHIFVQQELPFSKQGLSSRYCPSQNGTALLKTHFVQDELPFLKHVLSSRYRPSQKLPFSKHVLSSRNYPSQSMFCPADRLK